MIHPVIRSTNPSKGVGTVLKISKTSIVYILVGALVGLPFCAAAYAYEGMGEPTTFTTLIDVILYRPIGLLSIPVGFGLFVVSLPFSAVGGNVKKSYNNLVVTPANYTFRRPLGEIE